MVIQEQWKYEDFLLECLEQTFQFSNPYSYWYLSNYWPLMETKSERNKIPYYENRKIPMHLIILIQQLWGEKFLLHYI